MRHMYTLDKRGALTVVVLTSSRHILGSWTKRDGYNGMVEEYALTCGCRTQNTSGTSAYIAIRSVPGYTRTTTPVTPLWVPSAVN